MTLYMTHNPLHHHRSNPLLLASTLLVALGCILLTSCSTTSAQRGDDVPPPPPRATLSGMSVCLPHRDASGPKTMECALGLKARDGTHYALDLSVLQTEAFWDFPTNEEVVVEGTLVPLDDIDGRTWDVYDIAGQLRVTSVRREA